MCHPPLSKADAYGRQCCRRVCGHTLHFIPYSALKGRQDADIGERGEKLGHSIRRAAAARLIDGEHVHGKRTAQIGASFNLLRVIR